MHAAVHGNLQLDALVIPSCTQVKWVAWGFSNPAVQALQPKTSLRAFAMAGPGAFVDNCR